MTLDFENKFNQILQLMQTLKAASAAEIRDLRAENARLQKKVKILSGRRQSRADVNFSECAMADVIRMAKNTDALDGMENFSVGELGDGMNLTSSLTLDSTTSSYASGYDYSLLTAKEVLVTLHDVGDNNKDIDNGPGMWANYILCKERNRTLKCVNKMKLAAEGKYYHLKSVKKDLDIDVVVGYCKNKGIKAIVPTSVSDEIYFSTHIKTLHANGIYPFVCEDPQSYITLDHKWLSYQFCVENGIPMDETIPLRVDTADACRELAAKTIADGKPCFLKECFDTCAGDGVIRVDKMEDYEGAVKQITKGKGPQPADTPGVEQHIVLQAGHPGRISCCHNIFYKGSLVSLYNTKENMDLIDHLGDLRLDMAIGTWSTNTADLSMSLKLDLDDPADKNIRDQAIQIMQKVGKALNYTGMLELEFIIENKPDAVLHVLEFNPRFSGACHSYVGGGMVQDYMHVLGLIVTTNDDTEKVMAEKAGTLHVRSDTHEPRSNFKDYNAVKFYMPQPSTLFRLKQFK